MSAEYKIKLEKYPLFLGWTNFEEIELGIDTEAEFDTWHRERIIREIVNCNNIICGDTHQQNAIPVFTDGYVLVSMRVWADLMEEAYKLGHPSAVPYDYGNFYMAATCKIAENCPKEEYIKCIIE